MRGDEWTDEKRVFDDVIGSSYPMVDAVGKVTGSLKYVDDYYVPGMLCGKVVWSEEPSAQLLGIDASEALAVPGVVRVITHADCPDLYYGPLTRTRRYSAADVSAAVPNRSRSCLRKRRRSQTLRPSS